MKKVIKSIKRQYKQAKKHPKIAIPTAIVLVVVVGGLAALVVAGTGGGGDKHASATTDTEPGKTSKKDPGIEAAKKRKVKPAPVINGSGVLDTARQEGRLAIAQARGRIKNPTGVSVRVSAAPKQIVTVDYQLSCYKAVGKSTSTQVKSGRYRTRPPDTRGIELPFAGADECTVTVGAQLTRGDGRIKVAVLGD